MIDPNRAEKNPLFERWFYRWQRDDILFAGGPTPGGTVLLYTVCGNDLTKFDLALNLIQDAFEAGQIAGMPLGPLQSPITVMTGPPDGPIAKETEE